MRPDKIALQWRFACSMAAFVALSLAATPALGQGQSDYELPPINYSSATASNRLTVLQQRIESGELVLPSGDAKQVLERVLAELQCNADSQVLVFSKTSLQRRLISPDRPRAIYFGDDCYVGVVLGGLIEVAVTDPDLGLAFYQFNPRQLERPAFERDADCLSCHGGSMTGHWPGLLVRSVFADDSGEIITSAGSFLIGHESPLSERWGGWYVTGKHGEERHMGNVFAKPGRGQATMDRDKGANLITLDDFFPTARYLRPDSDIVALMVLEHQVTMHNRLAQGALRARKWMHYQEQLRKELGEPETGELTGTARRIVESEASKIVEYLLFCDEIKLPEGGIEGAPAFQTSFAKNRRTDSAGRSLKDFDLGARLFRFRCSYMIYSEAFDALPPALKNEVYRKLFGVLTAAEVPKRFNHLETEERTAIREILFATKTDIPETIRESFKP